MTDTSGGWDASSEAWIREQGDEGDYGRRHVLDASMVARLSCRPYAIALDVGCGEGRFCRIMQQHGIHTVGIDPTLSLIAHARLRDPNGDYRADSAETFDMPPASFDLVVSYLTLIDIPDLSTAIPRMVSALRPGGTLLIANLNSFNTAGMPNGWSPDADGQQRFCIDHYLEKRAVWVGWRGIRIQNWHRPLSTYMALLLAQNLQLKHFEEPVPNGGDPVIAARYCRVPWFHIMEWSKPPA